jgi:hypothetical protein
MKTFGAAKNMIALILLAGLLTPAPSVAMAASTTYSGQAVAVKGTVAGLTVGPLADTGPISPSGEARDATVLEYPIAQLPDPMNGAFAAEVFHAAVVAGGNTSSAEASVASFALSVPGESIAATFLMARASATCNGRSATVTGSSEIVELTLNNQTIEVGTEANQTILLPDGLGKIVINEQRTGSSVSGNEGDITVNALHVTLAGGTDVVVASAHADIACAGTPPPCAKPDFVTGGGWITKPSGAHANFAVAGGWKNDKFWGHLTYIDHDSPAMKVKGTAVTGYDTIDDTSREITGDADIDGTAGSYVARVKDGGEPGRGVDRFDLTLSTLSTHYTAGGMLSGGNIQLHCR